MAPGLECWLWCFEKFGKTLPLTPNPKPEPMVGAQIPTRLLSWQKLGLYGM